MNRPPQVSSPNLDEDLINQNIENGAKAIQKILSTKSDIDNAMYRDDIGNISFVWGTPGDPDNQYKGGYGISHIMEKHGRAVLHKMPEVIAKGKITKTYGPENGKRVNIGHEGHAAVISMFRNRDQNAWLLTGWDDK